MMSTLLTRIDEGITSSTGRNKPHNYGFEFPEECVSCKSTVHSFETGGKLVDGWLYCNSCNPDYQQFDHVTKDEATFVCPKKHADGFIHLSRDDEYHAFGGFWIPTISDWAEASYPPHGELIRYPSDDDVSPSIVGKNTLPDWVEE